MTKLALSAPSTFEATVTIPTVRGPEEVRMTFLHRPRAYTRQLVMRAADVDDVELLLGIATGWDLDDDFNAENLRLLSETHIAAPEAILEQYLKTISGGIHG